MIRVVCRYCAASLGLNEHLFEMDGPSRLSQQALRMNLIYPGKYNQSGDTCTELSLRKPLVNWRDYPPVCHIVEQGRVMALIDGHGNQLTRRFCPHCHGELDDEVFFGQRLVLGCSGEQDARVWLSALPKEHIAKKELSAPSYPFSIMNISLDGMPWPLQVDTPSPYTRPDVRRRLRAKQIQSADALLIHLAADPGETLLPGVEFGQLKMVRELEAFREDHLMSGFFVQIPVAVAIDMGKCHELYEHNGGAEAFLSDIEHNCPALNNWLGLLFLNYKLFAFAPDDDQNERAEAMIRWLMERVMAL